MDKALQDIEVDCLLEAIHQHYGYDFRNYARASLKRRIQNCMTVSGLEHISELIPRVLHDREFFGQYLNHMSVSVTEMFRSPDMFSLLRSEVIPKLKTYSSINIWHAGCATGEEAYSMAILLKEEGLLSRSRIYATDFNKQSLETAKSGIYPAGDLQKSTNNYVKAGGQGSFADYYWANYSSAKMCESLGERITFAHHNLMSDGIFARMHLVLCRNVLIYFDKTFQDRVLGLIRDSLLPRGFLVLGEKESLRFSSVNDNFETHNEVSKIFRKLNYA